MTFAIREVLEKLGTNEGWYNAGRILPHLDDCMVFWIVGERRIGKTDFFLHAAMLLWQDHGQKTMWLRNKKVELEDPAFYEAFLNDAVLHGWAPESYEVRADGVYDGKERFLLFQSISTFSNRRGGAHPGVTMMIFDEFMPEDRRYPTACAKGLMSLTKTVFSGRTDARVFCLSNFVSAANPYFVSFGIYPKPDTHVTIYADKGMAIERCHGYHKAIAEGNPWNAVYKAGNYGDYADESEDSLLNLVSGKIPNGAEIGKYLILKDGRYYAPYSKNGLIYWAEFKGRISSFSVYASTIQECSDSVRMLPKFHLKDMAEISSQGGYRFKSVNDMFAILSILYETV